MAEGASTATSLKLNWNAVSGAKSYIIHYIDKDTSTSSELTSMGYSETTSWELPESVHGSTMAGKEFTLAVQAYNEVGVGSTPIDKANYLHDGEFEGSVWSSPLTKVTIPLS